MRIIVLLLLHNPFSAYFTEKYVFCADGVHLGGFQRVQFTPNACPVIRPYHIHKYSATPLEYKQMTGQIMECPSPVKAPIRVQRE